MNPTPLLLEDLDPSVGDHPPVADEHHMLDPEGVLDTLNRGQQRGRIAGVALMHLDRDRLSGRRAAQPIADLRLARLAVARVPDRRQLTVAPLQVTGGQVIEHEPLTLQMTAGERLLDPLLARKQPVHRREQLGFCQLAQLELLRERGLVHQPGHRQLRARLKQPLADHRHAQVALATALP
jgi:hypothetical protein